MKKNYLFLIAIIGIISVSGCRNAGERKAEKQADIMTVKTLGLAYLEEFKLEEAEEQFLHFIELAPNEKLGYANLGLTYLRMSRYDDAEKQLNKAIKIDPRDADIRLILATVHRMNNQKEKAIAELKKALEFSADHVKTLYELSEVYSTMSGEDAKKQHHEYTRLLVEKAPGNLVPRLNFTDILIREGDFDAALEQMETINRQFPGFPREAVEYYNSTIDLLRKKDKENAIIQFTIFHNYLKVSAPYQAGIVDLKGPGGSLIGFPVITFDRKGIMQSNENLTLLDVIKFADASETAGLGIIPGASSAEYPALAVTCDYDGDGDADLYAGSHDSVTGEFRHFLFLNEMGKFTDITKESGLKHSGYEYGAVFTDFDNDGFPDLFIMREGGDLLYRNDGAGKFEDVTVKSKAGSPEGGKKALFFDMDHDGDLDLYELTEKGNLMFRNNADGTFTLSNQGLEQPRESTVSSDALFGDFDEDEDIDFIVTGLNSQPIYYSNQRQGVYKNIVNGSGLEDNYNASVITTGDYNNDGFLDVFTCSSAGGNPVLYMNKLNGTFRKEENSGSMFSSLDNAKIYDLASLDFNNDGFLDIMAAGEAASADGRGVFLYYNDRNGGFKDVSELLPLTVKSSRQITVFDYNDDGDLDAVISGLHGRVTLLRNDGGNNNHFITMKLVGLKAGSAKNNHFGIGAKVEIRAGDQYQVLVVTDPQVHFGLGNKPRADIIRIRWTNGVPQNIFLPGSDQALIEEQTLKGSCPFLYTWDGDKYIFVKDILWRSGLGMPTGIMGGNTSYAFADASDDYLKIPGEFMKPDKGRYSIQVTSELWETIYIDQLELVAVDHPGNTEIYVPEQFSPPPFPGKKIIKISEKISPASAVDSKGNDILQFVSEKDDIFYSWFAQGKYQGITEMHDIIIDPGRKVDKEGLHLFMTGWIFPTDASINFAMSQSDSLKSVPPLIQVINRKGKWETVVESAGFPQGKDKTVIIDLSGKLLSEDTRIRIRTNMQIYWDEIFLSNNNPELASEETVMQPVSGDLHYRGFSKLYRKGGRYGPHWFNYSSVEKAPRWRDLTGNYTRFGDVLPLLTESDNKYVITNAGDETTVEFDAGTLPPLKEGWKRDFLIRSVGWVKDGDMNTAFGNTVLPLPFHGMKSYPPSPEDNYPDDPELEKYNREYNTRVVDVEEYANAVRAYEKN
ncbi:MAG TPA: hypothetical protein DCY25_03785 [Bacteroidales bacterium]|nr:hypothetical protein [Bacteroidales bacterium]